VKLLLVGLLSLIFLSSCVSPPIYGYRQISTRDLSHPVKMGVIVLDRGTRDGYNDSFHRMYGDHATYCAAIGSSLQGSLNGYGHAAQVALSKEQEALLKEAAGTFKSEPERLAGVFSQFDAEYDRFLVVFQWRIERDRDPNPIPATHLPSQTGIWGGMTTPAGSEIICTVRLAGGIFDREGRVLELGESKRSSPVNMFAFGRALKAASHEAASTLAQLLTHRLPEENIENRPMDFGNEK
jgi:hypothetical protein